MMQILTANPYLQGVGSSVRVVDDADRSSRLALTWGTLQDALFLYSLRNDQIIASPDCPGTIEKHVRPCRGMFDDLLSWEPSETQGGGIKRLSEDERKCVMR